jgi:hypothetical protein
LTVKHLPVYIGAWEWGCALILGFPWFCHGSLMRTLEL